MNRVPLTCRQALRRALQVPSTASHFLVQFKDGAVSVIWVKNIVEPSVANLKIFSNCEVRWSDRKTYQATVLAMGKDLYKFLCVYTVYVNMFLYSRNRNWECYETERSRVPWWSREREHPVYRKQKYKQKEANRQHFSSNQKKNRQEVTK